MKHIFRDKPKPSGIPYLESIDLSLEHMIAVQNYNDPIIAKMIELVKDTSEDIKDKLSYTKNRITFFESKKGQEFFTQLASLINQRFGIHAEFFNMDTLAACCPQFTGKLSVLGQMSMTDLLTELDTDAELARRNKDTYEDIVSYKSLERIALAQHELADYIKKLNIKVDLKNAKIDNLPKDVKSFITIDICQLVRVFSCSPKEVVAVILHEVGHLFTFISSSFRNVYETSVLMNTFLENVTKRNKSNKEALLLCYKQITKRDISKFKDKSTVIVCTSILNEIMHTDLSLYHTIDAEQQADQFVGRLGLGDALFTALTKTDIYIGIISQRIMAATGVGALMQILLCCILATESGLGAAMLIVFLFPMAFLCLLIYITWWFGKRTETDVNAPQTYDNIQDRLKRIRMEMIRSLRLTDNEKVKQIILGKLQEIDKIESLNRKYSVDIGNKISSWFSAITSHRLEARDIERLTEQLMENDLHVAAFKLKQKI